MTLRESFLRTTGVVLCALCCNSQLAPATLGGAGRPQTAAGAPGTPSAPSELLRVVRHFERLRREPPALRAFLRAFPKGADLHTHLTGAVYAESYVRWAAELLLCIDLGSFSYVQAARSPSDAERQTVVCHNPSTQRPAADVLDDISLFRSVVDALSTRYWNPARGPGHYQFFDPFIRFGAITQEGRDPATAIAARSVAEVVHRAALQNVLHLELMMSLHNPALDVATDGMDWSDDSAFSDVRERIVAAGLQQHLAARRSWLDRLEADTHAALRCGAQDASPGCDLSVRYMPYALRGLPPGQVFSRALFAFALAAADSRIAGVNLVMPEDWPVPMRDYDLHMRMFRFLRTTYPGVHVALHAGELALGLVPPEQLGVHVRQAIEIGGARRIGHGTDVMHDRDPASLLRALSRRGVAVEISLSSSDIILGIRGSKHPLRQFLRAGVPVVIMTDDEGVARSDLTNEYQRAVEEQGLSYAELKQISRNSIKYSFLPAAEKARLARRLESALARFERELR